MRTKISGLTASFVVAVSGVSAYGQQPGITGVQAGGTGFTYINGLNADGTVAVGRGTPGAFRWQRTPEGGTVQLLPRGDMGYTVEAGVVSDDGAEVYGWEYKHEAGNTSYIAGRWNPPYSSWTSINSSSCGSGTITGMMPLDAGGLVIVGTWLYLGAGPTSYRPAGWLNSGGTVSSFCFPKPSGWDNWGLTSVSRDGAVMLGSLGKIVSPGPGSGTFLAKGPPGGPWTVEVYPQIVDGPLVSMISKDGAFAFGKLSGNVVRWAILPTGLGEPLQLTMPPDVTTPSISVTNLDGTAAAGFVRRESVSVPFVWTRDGGVVILPDYMLAHGISIADWTLTNIKGMSHDGSVIAGGATHEGLSKGYVLVLPPRCGSSDFNCDGDYGTDADIEAFFACLGGDCSQTCSQGSDFNGDGDFGTDADIEAFFRVLAGGAC